MATRRRDRNPLFFLGILLTCIGGLCLVVALFIGMLGSAFTYSDAPLAEPLRFNWTPTLLRTLICFSIFAIGLVLMLREPRRGTVDELGIAPSSEANMPKGFRLGNFQFFDPSEAAPLDRRRLRPDEPLRGAPPPDWLAGLVFEAANTGPATLLWRGDWRGHGEPAYSVFGVGGSSCDTVQLAALQHDALGDTVLVRESDGAPWSILHATNWFPLAAIPAGGQSLPPTAANPITGPDGGTQMRLAIGFEYPIDCSSQNEVGWVAIAALEPRGTPFIVFEAELT